MGRKILLIAAALTLVVAGAALYLSLSSTSGTAAGPTKKVLVAAGDLPPGTPTNALTSAQLTQIEIPATAVPAGALTSLSEVENLKLTVPVFKGQTMIQRMFATTNATGGLAIPPGQNAVSVELSDPQRVAGFVQPGSQVVVYSTINGEPTVVLLPKASVIAVGATTETGAGTSNKLVATTVVTFALRPEEAAKVVDASAGTLYLGLLPTEAKPSASPSATTAPTAPPA